MKTEDKALQKVRQIIYALLWLGLAVFAFRKVNKGLDLWDTGYNLANFQWMGTEHMDNMWLFSTYLSNVIGHLFSLLPGGKTLLGMNIYTTGVTVLLMVSVGYFLSRYMKIPQLVIIAGEFIALNLCWAPSAILYDYLTFAFLDLGLVLMLIGLTKEQKKTVILSGIMIGANMFVRFSNLAQLIVIVLIPAYYIIMWIECVIKRKKGQQVWLKEMLGLMAAFLSGYILIVAILLGYISVRYGFGEYVKGIGELMAMSKTTPGYSAGFMIEFLFSNLIRYGLRLWHVAAAAILGIICAVIADRVDSGLHKHILCYCSVGISILLGIYVVHTYLTKCDYITTNYYSYSSVYAPMILVGALTIFIAVIRVFSKEADMAEKFLGVIVVSIYLLSVIGSSTEFHLGMNNYFLLVPYLMWEIYLFCRRKISIIPMYPAKIIVSMFVAFCCFLTIGFGQKFIYEEAGSRTGKEYEVKGNSTLRGIVMTEEKAMMMQGLSDYLAKENLVGSDVILYEGNPSLAFYLQLPPAFNSWPSQASYSCDKLMADLADMETREELPIMIFDDKFDTDNSTKAEIFRQYIKTNGYQKTYSVGKFTVYRSLSL